MITIQQEALHNMIRLGIDKAISEKKPFLVSHTYTMEQIIHPLSFFASGRALYAAERAYWSDPNKELTLVGIGTAYSLQPEGQHRYQEAEEGWKDILARAVYNEHAVIPGTGPLLMGGFSFDPQKPKTTLWKHYPEVKLVVPRFLLTVQADGTSMLTINEWVEETSQPDKVYEELISQQQLLFEGAFTEDFAQTEASDPLYIEEVAPNQWKKSVQRLAAEINRHELEKVVLAREVRIYNMDTRFRAEGVLDQLVKQQKNSYLFAFTNEEDNCFLGATPERLIKQTGRELLSTCLAGSSARGKTKREDESLAQQLLHDKKNRHEHELVVKMIEDALRSDCETLTVPDAPVIYQARDIQHLYTPIKGIAKRGVTLLSFVDKLHPTPALGGYPQQAAVKKIRDEEMLDRGWYAAPVGWMDSQGNGEFAVAIRSGLLQGNEASLFAGCGIVGDSDPESEYNETQIKLKPMLSALGGTINVSN